jgi:antitoxin HigA-1
LCRFFQLSDGWWLRLQASHDAVTTKRRLAGELEKIVPLERAA